MLRALELGRKMSKNLLEIWLLSFSPSALKELEEKAMQHFSGSVSSLVIEANAGAVSRGCGED